MTVKENTNNTTPWLRTVAETVTEQTHFYSPTEPSNQRRASQLLFTRWIHLKSAQFHWLTPNQAIA